MFSDSRWYPAHVLLLAGMALMAAALVGLARRVPTGLPRRTTRFAAFAAVVGTAAMVLHLFAKLDDANIVAGETTPLLFTHAGGRDASPSRWWGSPSPCSPSPVAGAGCWATRPSRPSG